MAGKFKIAILRALYLGDLLTAVPAWRSIRAGFPDAEITLISLPWARSFAERFSTYIDRFIELPGYPGLTDGESDDKAISSFLQTEQRYAYDLVIQMHGRGDVSTHLALELKGARTAGFYPCSPPAGLAIGAPYPEDQPEIVRNLQLAFLLGCPDTGMQLEFPIGDIDHKEASSLLPSGPMPLIGIHPGSKRPAQRWSAENFASVADALAEEVGALTVMTGSTQDELAVEAVRTHMAQEPIVLANKTSLGGLAAVLQKLDLFISNDTGPAHLAEALGTQTIRLFGPGDHRRWGPLDESGHAVIRQAVPCSPCDFWQCPIDHRCLNRVTPDMVLTKARQALSDRRIAA